MDLSIIVPVYNTPIESLSKCFQALKFSEEIKTEIIIVDDGSKNEIGDFCRNYASENENFRYIYQQNKGVSSARNTGIENAVGKYIMFVDADDELLSDNIKKKYFDIDCDIVFFNMKVREGKSVQHWKVFEEMPLPQPEKKDFFLAACYNKINGCIAKLIRRSLLIDNNINFDESMIVAEDAEFVFSTVLVAEKMAYEDVCVYCYKHSYDNGNKRLVKSPQKYFANMAQFFKLKKESLAIYGTEFGFSEKERQENNVAVEMRIVEDFFNCTGSLFLSGNMTKEVYSAINELFADLKIVEFKSFPIKSKIKYSLLEHRMKLIIKFFAWLREVYIKFRISD